MLFLSLLFACATPEPEDPSPLVADGGELSELPEEITQESESNGSGAHTLSLDEWELAVIKPQLEEIRAGVKLSGPDGLGICEQDPVTKGCSSFLGRSPELLPEGDFYFRAVLEAPRESTGWKVSFTNECKLTHPDGRIQELKPGPQVREVKWRGGTPSTLRLSSFKAPGTVGNRECNYTLISLRNDGKETARFTGEFHIPGP
jgi:hypothetical protein